MVDSKKELEKRIERLEEEIRRTEEAVTLVTELRQKVSTLEDIEESEVSQNIRIYRQYWSFHLENARVMKVTAKFFLLVPAKSESWIYGLPGYLPSLIAKTGDGNEIPILSDQELNLLFTNENAKFVTQESLKNLYLEQIGIEEPGKDHSSLSQKHFVGLLIPRIDVNHFQEIILEWTEQIPVEYMDSDIFSKYVRRQHVIEPTTESSVYVNISMDEKKYEIVDEPIISAVSADGNDAKIENGNQFQRILSDKTQYVFRIKRNCPLTFHIKWFISIPKFIKQWACAGFLISISILLYSFISFLYDNSMANENTPLLAGLVAMLVGFRILLLHDTDFLSRWNSLYLTLIGLSVFLILILQSKNIMIHM